MEIDHEIISTVILLPSAESFKKGCCPLQAKVCARSVTQEKSAVRSIDRPAMIIAVGLGRKATKQSNYKKSCRNNKKRENLEYYFITCIFPNVRLKTGFRKSCSVRRKLFEESSTTALTPNLLGISTILGFLKSGGGIQTV